MSTNGSFAHEKHLNAEILSRTAGTIHSPNRRILVVPPHIRKGTR